MVGHSVNSCLDQPHVSRFGMVGGTLYQRPVGQVRGVR